MSSSRTKRGPIHQGVCGVEGQNVTLSEYGATTGHVATEIVAIDPIGATGTGRSWSSSQSVGGRTAAAATTTRPCRPTTRGTLSITPRSVSRMRPYGSTAFASRPGRTSSTDTHVPTTNSGLAARIGRGDNEFSTSRGAGTVGSATGARVYGTIGTTGGDFGRTGTAARTRGTTTRPVARGGIDTMAPGNIRLDWGIGVEMDPNGVTTRDGR